MFYAPISKAGASGALGSRCDRFAKPRHLASFDHPLLPSSATDLIEALPQSMALVDANWVIVAANSEWTVAAVRRGYADMLAVGQCFRSFCEWLVMMGFNDGAVMLRGMAAIDEGRASEFQHQHASPRGPDRMQLLVNAFDVAGAR